MKESIKIILISIAVFTIYALVIIGITKLVIHNQDSFEEWNRSPEKIEECK